jgi:hypothetical protein
MPKFGKRQRAKVLKYVDRIAQWKSTGYKTPCVDKLEPYCIITNTGAFGSQESNVKLQKDRSKKYHET